MSKLLFPLQFSRQYAAPLDADTVFETTAERIDYLTNARRYAGQIVSDEEDGNAYKLNAAKDAWEKLLKESDAGSFATSEQWAKAEQALEDAAAAQTKANSAFALAGTANDKLVTIEPLANAAYADSQAAQVAAAAAQESADNAQDSANAAGFTAQNAASQAGFAESLANDALDNAADALSIALDGQTTAYTAQDGVDMLANQIEAIEALEKYRKQIEIHEEFSGYVDAFNSNTSQDGENLKFNDNASNLFGYIRQKVKNIGDVAKYTYRGNGTGMVELEKMRIDAEWTFQTNDTLHAEENVALVGLWTFKTSSLMSAGTLAVDKFVGLFIVNESLGSWEAYIVVKNGAIFDWSSIGAISLLPSTTYKLRLMGNSAAIQVFLNDVLKDTMTTNIPTTNLDPVFAFEALSGVKGGAEGSIRYLKAGAYHARYTLNTAR